MKKILAALLMVPCVALAEFWSGNTLLDRMNGDTMDRVQAYGYVIGVFDTSAGVDHCGAGTSGLNVKQVNDIVKQYLEQNPSTRNYSADLLARVAFSKTWPCSKKGKGV